MDSARRRRTSGRQSAAVYRRRRLLFAALALVILVGLGWGASAIFALFVDDGPHDPGESSGQQNMAEDDEQDAGSEDEEASGSADESDNEGEAEDVGDEASEDGVCSPGDLSVTADTGEDVYSATEAPLLILHVENTGAAECTLDVGTAQQEFTVAHAGREVFTTAQCGQDDDSFEIAMEPGQQERAHLDWPRSDSSVSCTDPAELEPGTYELTVSLSGISSEPAEFILE